MLAARAFPGEGSIAYAPIAELLRAGLALDGATHRLAGVPHPVLAEVARLVSLPADLGVRENPAAAESPAARARLLDAVAVVVTALVAGPVPGLVVVEDVQWADDASREAVRYLARRLTGRSLLLVLTWRSEELDTAGAVFVDAVDALPDTVRVPLERLDTEDVATLVAAAGAGATGWDPASLAAESEGLPLYVVEAIAAGPSAEGEAPRGVRALLHERLASVGETAAQVLAAAAVIGRTFDLGTVRAASGRSEDETIDALEELVRRAIVREADRGGEPVFDFGHARLRDAAYEEIGLARRRLLHRRVAEVLRSAGRQDAARLAQIAGHELGAGRDVAAADAYRRRRPHGPGGVRQSRGARAPVGGARARPPGRRRSRAGDRRGADGGRRLRGSDRRARGQPPPRRTTRGSPRSSSAWAACTPGAAMPRPRPRISTRRSRARPTRPNVPSSSWSGGRWRSARATWRSRARLRATRVQSPSTLDDPRTEASIARLAGLVAHRAGDPATAHAELTRSLELAATTDGDDPGPAIAARNALALVEAERGDRAAAIGLLEEALAECRRTGEPHLEAAVENNLADQLHAAGRSEEAMTHLKRAVALFAEVGGRPGELEPEIWKLVSW